MDRSRPDAAPSSAPPSVLSTGKGKAGLALIVLIGLAQLGLLLYLASPQELPSLGGFQSERDEPVSPLWGVLGICGATFLPATLMVLGKRSLRQLGLGWLIVVSVLWLALGLLTLEAGFAPVSVLFGGLTLASALLMGLEKTKGTGL
ncbi:hypothetical protein [Hyalangium rubrum]|uniref:Uncharacterized protein n=1 Tax=Hyalangium rubrum TaxID=3103134 RepID=A0ABU5GZ98_9BACT|nr:hypothetical protein [Hyalangium sp. s54d21]MDY7226517.1 hypothetical protein [Hyalangium sp. s54d21]